MNTAERDKAYIAVLEGRIEQLEDRVRELTAMLTEPAFAPWPGEWGLTRKEELFLFCLRSGQLTAKKDVIAALYPGVQYPPDAKILDVMACKLRKKLKPFGKTVEGVWGKGLRFIDTPILEEQS